MGNITGEVDRLLFSLPLVALNRLVEFQISLSEPFFFFFKLELLVGSLSSEMKMCFERRGKLNRLLSKLYFKLVGGALDVFSDMLCLELAVIRASVSWLSLFQGWRMRRCNWPSNMLAAQKKSSPWPPSGSHSQSTQLSWFQFRTVSHNHTHCVLLGDHPLIVINWNSLSTGQTVGL